MIFFTNSQIPSTLIEYQYLRDIWFPRIYKSNFPLCLPGICLHLFAEGLGDSSKNTCRHLFPKPASVGVGHWKRWAPPVFREPYLSLAHFKTHWLSFSVCELCWGSQTKGRIWTKVSGTIGQKGLAGAGWMGFSPSRACKGGKWAS